jgi:hypothetical protein
MVCWIHFAMVKQYLTFAICVLQVSGGFIRGNVHIGLPEAE